MIYYKIIGRSNIGDRLKEYLKTDVSFKLNEDNPNLIFLVGSKESIENFKREDYPNVKIVDVSSHKRLSSSTAFVETGNDIIYGIPNLTTYHKHYNYVANPGCSAIGVLTALHPIIDFLKKDIIADVRFSKSSLTRKSSFNDKEGIMTVVHPFVHTHQKEINHYFGNSLNIKMVPSIIDVPSGTSINIYAFIYKNERDVDIFSKLEEFYSENENIFITEDRPYQISDIVGTENIGIFVKREGKNLFLNIVLDNLTVGGAYTAYLNALKIMEK